MSTTAILPHYFIASRSIGEAQVGSYPLKQLVDAFVLEANAVHPQDVVVGVDARGELNVAFGPGQDKLSDQARAQLHFQEMARPTRRVLTADALYVFSLELVEHIANPADLNDPVNLYGTLLGPLSLGSQGVLQKGQLTVTRGDLLLGFSASRDWAFKYASTGPRECSCVHALVPGAQEPEIRAGKGLVLVYPMAPAEVADEGLDNAAVLELIVSDTLNALRADIEARDQQRTSLSRWFGTSDAKKLLIPEGATQDLLFERVRVALTLLPDWPSERSKALFERVRALGHRPSMSVAARHKSPPTFAPATGNTPLPAQAPPQPSPARSVRSDGHPEWMEDFLRDHRAQGRSVKYSAWRERKPEEPRVTGPDPEWMQDFAQKPSRTSNAPKPQSDRPDWMDDFEDE